MTLQFAIAPRPEQLRLPQEIVEAIAKTGNGEGDAVAIETAGYGEEAVRKLTRRLYLLTRRWSHPYRVRVFYDVDARKLYAWAIPKDGSKPRRRRKRPPREASFVPNPEAPPYDAEGDGEVTTTPVPPMGEF